MQSKTLVEWCQLFDITMLDPDGFDRTDHKIWERKFTLQEFNQGIVRCTCTWKSDSWKRIDQMVKEMYGDVQNV